MHVIVKNYRSIWLAGKLGFEPGARARQVTASRGRSSRWRSGWRSYTASIAPSWHLDSIANTCNDGSRAWTLQHKD